MQQIVSVWANLDPRRRLIVAGATVIMVLAILSLSSIATRPNMTLLYAGLEESAAGEVVQSLETRGTAYEIRGGTIFVDATARDELRMTLAAEGLPANATGGYELLDNLSGFGTTSQMFDAAYWRAKEGELARTIVSSPQIRSARVHIANPSSQPFARQIASSASVTVTSSSGAVSTQQARAFRYLVASAVAGLSPDSVSIIDGRNGIVISTDENGDQQNATDLSSELKLRVERILEARVGHGHAVVEVSVETVTDQEEIIERRFDPDGRVAISSEIEERSTSAQDTRAGAVTVASNLPTGDGASGGDSNSSNSETRERINYEVSETRREVQRGPGAIKRVTVAVLVDGVLTSDAEGEVWEARASDELEALRELVASAVGFDESRGDQITIKSMQFEPVVSEGTLSETGGLAALGVDVMSIIQLAVLAVVTLILGLFVLRPILTKPAQPTRALVNAMEAPAEPAQGTALARMPEPALNGEIDNDTFELPTLGVVSDFDFGDDDIGIPTDPVKRLKKLIEDRESETVEILRGWMEEKGENA
ncbi:flagellar basal-body MS-ring/collar protein FliF [Celeribacter arenosi]|uniref:Flagellar M-ring protein n=1 Tax=Celeribacter arenosi TaxID=792649 RepID=A0ABP7JXS1_9RHOB